MHSPPTLIAALAAALILPAPVAAHAASPTEVVSARAVTPVVDTATGWAYPELEVHLRDPAGLPDLLGEPAAQGLGGSAPNPGALTFPYLSRVSGTATDGVWRGSLRVSPAWAGTFTVDQVYGVVVANGPAFTVLGDRWVVTPVRQTLRVVSGDEKWRPRARLTRVDGMPVGGGRVQVGGYRAWVAPSPPPGEPADADGWWTSSTPLSVTAGLFLGAWGARGTRGYSLQGVTCNDFTVKLQAASTYPAGPVAKGDPVVVTGNVWPAPVILRAGGAVQLQRQSPAGWLTVATVVPRDNGRYTLTWQSPPTGTHTLRVRRPGTGTPAECEAHSIGTSLAAATVTVR